MSYSVVLDSEPVSRMATNHKSAGDVYVQLEAATRLNRRIYMPTLVMTELLRGTHRQAIYAWLAKMGGLVDLVDTDMELADEVGGVLFGAGAGSSEIVDAHCIAVANKTAARSTVLTGDVGDLEELAANYPRVTVKGL